jgi:hypothetical protein
LLLSHHIWGVLHILQINSLHQECNARGSVFTAWGFRIEKSVKGTHNNDSSAPLKLGLAKRFDTLPYPFAHVVLCHIPVLVPEQPL